MNRFAALLDRLAYEPGRNAKLRRLGDSFRTTPDPDRGYALAAITGALSFRHAKPGIIRALIAERTDPVLFGLSYDYVGDLSETVALMWPGKAEPLGLPSRPLAGRVDRVSEANASGVGGLRLLRAREWLHCRLCARGCPPPRPLPATRFARGGRGAGRAVPFSRWLLLR